MTTMTTSTAEAFTTPSGRHVKASNAGRITELDRRLSSFKGEYHLELKSLKQWLFSNRSALHYLLRNGVRHTVIHLIDKRGNSPKQAIRAVESRLRQLTELCEEERTPPVDTQSNPAPQDAVTTEPSSELEKLLASKWLADVEQIRIEHVEGNPRAVEELEPDTWYHRLFTQTVGETLRQEYEKDDNDRPLKVILRHIERQLRGKAGDWLVALQDRQ